MAGYARADRCTASRHSVWDLPGLEHAGVSRGVRGAPLSMAGGVWRGIRAQQSVWTLRGARTGSIAVHVAETSVSLIIMNTPNHP